MTGDAPGPQNRFDRWLESRLRESVPVDAGAVLRLKQAIREQPAPRPGRGRLFATRTVRLAPVPALAGILAMVVLAFLLGRRSVVSDGEMAHAPTAWTVTAGNAVRFVFRSEQAHRVDLVGDFNDWNPAVTPLRPTGREGIWSVEVRLPPGRHEYAFLVDGERWVPDGQAPAAPDRDFGTSNSIVLVRSQP